jgi:hypothetical protein
MGAENDLLFGPSSVFFVLKFHRRTVLKLLFHVSWQQSVVSAASSYVDAKMMQC